MARTPTWADSGCVIASRTTLSVWVYRIVALVLAMCAAGAIASGPASAASFPNSKISDMAERYVDGTFKRLTAGGSTPLSVSAEDAVRWPPSEIVTLLQCLVWPG